MAGAMHRTGVRDSKDEGGGTEESQRASEWWPEGGKRMSCRNVVFFSGAWVAEVFKMVCDSDYTQARA